MSQAVKLKEQPADVARQAALETEKQEKAGKEAFRDKTFADLTNKEKDDLLKQLAIAAGLVLE